MTFTSICVKAFLILDDGLGRYGDSKRWFHRECIKLNKTEYNRLSGDNNIKWLCTRNYCVFFTSDPLYQNCPCKWIPFYQH